MKISLDWLRDFIEITETDNQKIKDIITERSAEIETMENQGEGLENIVVGKIVDVKNHPNADALKLCLVNDGHEDINVVCGGSNVREGMLVAFAKIGAVVRWHGSEVVKMQKAKIRGEESFGMICASEEIGLEDMFPKKTEKEIVDLSHLDLKVGAPLANALGLNDVVIDVDNHAITNRSDLFSQRGFAREFVACGLGKWKKGVTCVWEDYVSKKLPKNNSPAPIEVEIKDKDTCSHYMAVYLTDVEVKESPDWVKKRLIACGVNPINNIVDITNYVMLELGMPLHAFDVDKVKGKKWTMRKSKKGEKVVTLDEQEHELMEDVIVLDDGHELIDLCGIMGGFSSRIDQHTKKVWLISPVYNPTLVRKGMRGLGHISDAAIIYEKGVDPELAGDGLYRAIELILELCPDTKVASDVVDVRNKAKEERSLELRQSQVTRLIGVEIPKKQVETILNDLGFETKDSKDGFTVSIPSYRNNDVFREADLIEEVARIHGYNNVPYITPIKDLSPVTPRPERVYERDLKNQLVSFGFNEIYTYAFLGPELLKKAGMEAGDDFIEIANPISSDMSLMRTSLLPRMLETIADNLRYQEAFRLFELNRTYHRKSDDDYEERECLVAAVVGEDFRALQGVVEELFQQILPAKSELKPYMHPGRTGEIIVRGQSIGHLYEVHPQVLKRFDIKKRVTLCEVDIQAVHAMKIDQRKRYQELPKYPSVKLDISILIPKKNLAKDYFTSIEKTDQKLIKQVDLIDEYVGEKIAEDKRALTYSITYQAPDRTLTDGEVEAVHKQLIKRLEDKGAEVRI
jgi:phenylalanyl-tRNA synthetase beta chain